jgi:hypothetical protein
VEFRLKNIIWKLFGVWEQKRDNYKNSANKGIRQRYNEILAEEYDEQTQSLLDNVFINCVSPSSMYAKFLPYMEEFLGVMPSNLPIEDRRKLLKYAIKFNQAKGTIVGLRMLLTRINVTCTITEFYDSGSFDNGTFDNEEGFDRNECNQFCGSYSIEAFGPEVEDETTMILEIERLAKLNNPIHAKIKQITYTKI